MHLWSDQVMARLDAARPLAARMRPGALGEVLGQPHLLGPDGLLTAMLGQGLLSTLIMHGPPGSGKTTLAHLLAQEVGRPFEAANAATIGVKRIREIIDASRERLAGQGPATVLFLDEIHRFSRSQQDVLLGDVERGIVSLIGATTENPFYTVNDALISRATLVPVHRLEQADMAVLLDRALAEDDRLDATLDDDARDVLADLADGDARRALNALELAAAIASCNAGGVITEDIARQAIGGRVQRFDRRGDQHYDLASALIKSIRASDADAAVHWLAVLLESGEDPRFICRRLAILASEDVGLASPHAMTMAASAWQIVERIGLPEAELTLSELVLYLATCPKSNASARAIWDARASVREDPVVEVPLHLRPGSTRGASALGYGQGYVSGHDDPATAREMDNIGRPVSYFAPSDHGFEATIKARLDAEDAT